MTKEEYTSNANSKINNGFHQNITGWLFDIYSINNKIILWIKDADRKTYRIEKEWSPSLYVTSNNQAKLERILSNTIIKPLVKRFSLVHRFEKASDLRKSRVLKITVKNSQSLVTVAKKIEQSEPYGIYRLYNVDIPPEQTYLYENDLFVLGKYKIDCNNKWIALDKIHDTDYNLPKFSKVMLQVNAIKPTTNSNNQAKKKRLAQFSDKIESIQINEIIIQLDSEKKMIQKCIKIIQRIDPDLIITQKGDSWDFPYLIHRAQVNEISEKLVLGREKNVPSLPQKKTGNSFFAYGQIYYKPTAVKTLGRIHIDTSNCFFYEHEQSNENEQGLFEIARTCRLPLQTASRASIGKCMSSVQFYNATKRKLLIPWKPVVAEQFKSRMDLLIGDRGGLILEPKIGLYENVAELDFASLFGNIMLKKNISAETINCKCCCDLDSKIIVPELDYYICKREGIVPQSISILLEKRQKYTDLIDSFDVTKRDSEILLETYKARKAALKWILVTSFGYLGFNNAKFGRIDAHMAVCSFARQLLLQSIKIAETNHFQVLHGIVDSLWLYKKDATRNDYQKLQESIEQETGFGMSLDIYNWIVFLPSKQNKIIPVPNRYFGAKTDGSIKIRGIESRRRDTPEFFKKCQIEILQVFSSCKTIAELKMAISEAKLIQNRHKKELFQYEVPLEQLVFTNKITRSTGTYTSKTIQADAVNQLKWEGEQEIAQGQKIRYIINDYSRKKSKRVTPIELTKQQDNEKNPIKYDARRYAELLDECCKSIIEPII